MKKIVIFLMLILFGKIYSQGYEEGTNPLAPTLPPPISKSEIHNEETQTYQKTKILKSDRDTSRTSIDTTFEYSENYKNYLREQSQDSGVLKDFKEKELAFNNYKSTTPVVDNSPNNQSIDFQIFLVIIGIMVVIVLFIFIKDKK